MTAAELLDTTVPNDSAVDSFSLLPILAGKQREPIRPYLLQQAFAGAKSLAIRRGQWKYLAHGGSGGKNYQTHPKLKAFSIPDNAPSASGQLYHL